ncbi:efflux RND transporter periplasmic adaptor subunit [Microvirga sp. STS02]|uniref:efflux RND transporter periplasmic adaptor subunit n=1 Tax=Hymenobacter negativus TaxID=2795026 RepID=UPI0018DCD037|nr:MULTISPECIES: efflux RND transporter periplasmic adaptor subunit [Bacteria]MBH8570373.1 efflux RND transporter periplasmic adaptor subunit [Hymenobacter negativus]MBR7210112.1 efflux RND transporter periplasmic adaptor subunit [Microvirga sp. STS02]
MNSFLRCSFLHPLLLTAAAGWLAAGLSGCSAKAEKDTVEAPPEVPVVTLKTSSQSLHRDYVADIQAVRNVEVRAQVAGFLEHIYVDEGKPVKKGQPLFRINASAYRNRLSQAQAAVASAQAQAAAVRVESDRVKLLVDKNVIAKTELKLTNSKIREADARVADARAGEAAAHLSLSYTLVRAPFDGVIDRIPLKMGSVVEEGTLLTTVSDLSAVFAYFDVAEGSYMNYTKARREHPELHSDSVRLTLANGELYPLTGHIETAESEFNPNTGSIALRARFANPDRLLKHGASGKVRLTDQLPAALLLPQKAVFEIQDQNFVYVVDQAGVTHTRSFKPQTRLGDFYVVKEGLKPGERVVYEGAPELHDQQRIKVKPVLLDTAAVAAQ